MIRAVDPGIDWANALGENGYASSDGTLYRIGFLAVYTEFRVSDGSFVRVRVPRDESTYPDDRNADESTWVSIEEAKGLARQYAEVVVPGLVHGEPYSVSEGLLSSFSWFPTVSGIPLSDDHMIKVSVHRSRGRLIGITSTWIPDCSLANSDRVTEAQARSAAEHAYARFRPYGRAHLIGARLVLSSPNISDVHELTQEHVDLARARKAIPVYVFAVSEGTALERANSRFLGMQQIYVDARNGRAIAIRDWPAEAVLGGSVAAPYPEVAVPVGRVSVVGSVGGGYCSTAKDVPSAIGIGKPVLLRETDSFFRAEYFEDSGLLRLGEGESVVWARPDDRLRRSLISAAPIERGFGQNQTLPVS